MGQFLVFAVGGGWARHHVITSELMGVTVTTAAQFAHAHSLHNSNFNLFSVFRGVKIRFSFTT